MNKMKLVSSIILSGLALNVHAYAIKGINAQASGEPLEKIDVSKLPQTGEGVHIVNNKSEMPDVKLPKSIKLAMDNQKQLGYVPRKSYDAIQLLTMQAHLFQKAGDSKFFTSSEPSDSHLKKKLSQIPLGFPHHALTFISESDTLGFAPAMTYQPTGWTGVVQFFNYPAIGACKYLKSSVSLNGSAIRLLKQEIQYYINEKPAQVMTEGQEKEGYAYLVHWYDNQYFHELTCANQFYDKERSDKLLSLAKMIDKDGSVAKIF